MIILINIDQENLTLLQQHIHIQASIIYVFDIKCLSNIENKGRTSLDYSAITQEHVLEIGPCGHCPNDDPTHTLYE